MKLTVEIPDEQILEKEGVVVFLQQFFAMHCISATVTPAEPTAAELLQAWKDGCNDACSLGETSKVFPCQCICGVPKEKWDIPKILELCSKESHEIHKDNQL